MIPLTGADVLEQLMRLHVAFPTHQGMKSQPERTAEVYRDGLHGLGVEALTAAARVVIESDTFFPKVARLREVAWDWTRRHRVELEPVLSNELWCPRCQTTVQWVERWRPRVDGAGFLMLSEDKQFVALERVGRYLCACAPPSPYTPDEQFDDAWMARDQIKWSCGRPGRATVAGTWTPRALLPAGAPQPDASTLASNDPIPQTVQHPQAP